MQRVTLAVLISCVLTACGSSGEAGPTPVPLPSGGFAPDKILSRAAAQSALQRAAAYLVGGTARYRLVIQFGAGEESPTVTQVGSVDGPRKLWQATLTEQQGASPSQSSVNIIGTTEAIYVTSPRWPVDIRGRWYRYSNTQLDGAIAEATGSGGGGTDLSGGLPAAAEAILETTARSGRTYAGGTTINADLPSSLALNLAGLKPGLAKLKVELSTITGTTAVKVELSTDGRPRRLVLSRGAFNGLDPQLPTLLRSFARQIAMYATFDGFDEPVVINVPKGKELVPASEMRP